MQNITPFLWFDTQAEEAATLYTSVFKNSRILNVTRYPEGSPAPAGSAMSVTFEIDGLHVQALNAGPMFQFTEAISLLVNANTQPEIDEYWARLTADGGEPSRCGWLKDKFGLSWQIVPALLGELLADPDPEKSGRTMQAMLAMQKIDIGALQAAHYGTNLDTA